MFDKKKYLAEIQKMIDNGPYSESWDSLEHYRVPKWYKDAKLGIFIHWGVYAVPAYHDEWYPRFMYVEKIDREDGYGRGVFQHHVKTYGSQKEFGYKDFIPMFKAEKFDSDEWAEVFRESGARYVMPVGEHHDGFQMYKSEISKWNSAEMGPMKDICDELAKSVRSKGMKYCISSHRAAHWWFMGGGREFDSDVNDPQYEDFYGPAENVFEDRAAARPSEEFLEDWLIRTCEMVDRFHPAIVYFDGGIGNYAWKPYLKKFATYYYNHAAENGYDPAINYKGTAYPEMTAVYDLERGQLKDIRYPLWQTDTAVQKNSWSYTENQNYKKPQDIVCDLIDIVSKNGVLLLNVGPKADGTIPEPEKAILRNIGAWLKINGEAIYGTVYAKKFGEGPTKIEEGAFTDTKRGGFTSKDFRFTKNKDSFFVHVMQYPTDGKVTVESLKADSDVLGEIKKIAMLGCEEKVTFARDSEGLHLELPEYDAGGYPVVVKILV